MKKIIFSIFLLSSIITNAQVVTSITNLTSNASSISNCETINFASLNNLSISLTINLSKPQNQVVGISDLYVYTIGSSGNRIQRYSNVIYENQWLPGNSSNPATLTIPGINFNIPSTDFNPTGGALFAVFKSNGGNEYQTQCSYSVIKDAPPTFEISPLNLNLGCNDLNSKTFTVIPSNIPSGAVVTYQWSHPGWTLLSSTSNSRTLQPVSGTILPSNVTVTPSINFVAQQSKTCIVNRAPLNINPSLSGNAFLCPTSIQSTYTLTNVGAGFTVNWSLSSTTIATILSSNSSSAVVIGLQNGSVTLTATISNACNQQVTRNFTINVVANSASIQAPVSYVTNNNLLFYCTNPQNTTTCGIQTKTIAITQDNLLPTNFQFALQLGNAQIAQFVSPQSCFGCTSGNQPKYVANLTGKFYSSPIVVSVKANYNCNISSANFVTYLSLNAFNNRLSTTNNSFEIKLSPNVARDFVTITKEEFEVPYQKVVNNYLDRPVTDEELKVMQNEIKALEESVNAPMFVSIYTMQGIQMYSNEIKDFETFIDVSKYTKGMYFVKINRGVEQIVEKLLVD